MYQTVKILNNNGIIARCLDNKEEVIFLGKGIGFSRKTEDTFESIPDAKIYKLQKNGEESDKLSVLENVDPVFLDITNEIILLAEKKFGKIDNSILLPLADHIAFCVERMKNHLVISNPLTDDIRVLFAEEYEVAMHSIEIIHRYTGFTIDEQEVGYITMHIHSALTQDHISKSMTVALMVGNFIEQMEQRFHIVIQRDSLSYTRLMTHIKYMIMRALRKESLQVDITPYVKSEFPESYEIAKELCESLGKDINCVFGEVEISYLAIHVERVRRSDTAGE